MGKGEPEREGKVARISSHMQIRLEHAAQQNFFEEESSLDLW